MSNSIQVTLPIYWEQQFKTKPPKVWLCGMNNYRNWHHHTSNSWKTHYHELVLSQLPDNPQFNQFTLDIKLYYKRSCDPSNVVPLMEKAFLDALQSANLIPEDNVLHHISTTWTVAGQDKDNPRCEITIKDAL